MNRSTVIKLTSASSFGFSVIDLGIGLVNAFKTGDLGLSEVKGVVGVTGSVLLYFSTEDRAKRRREQRRAAAAPGAPDVFLSLEGGLLGGLLGGLAAGIPFALYYYFSALAPWSLMGAVGAVTEIVVYALIVGSLTGILVQSFNYLSRQYRGFRDIAAGLMGGAVAGLIVGLIGGARYGLRPTDAVDLRWLVVSIAFGASWIACGSLLVEHKVSWPSAARALLVVFVTAIVAGLAGAYLLDKAGVDLGAPSTPEMARKAGAEVGMICGAIMGMQITVTQVVYRFLAPKDEKERGPAKARKRRKKGVPPSTSST